MLRTLANCSLQEGESIKMQMVIISKSVKNNITQSLLLLLATLYLFACGSKEGPGPTPKPPWPDSPAPTSSRALPPLEENTPFKTQGKPTADVVITASADVWVLVKPKGKNEIWKNLRDGERLVVPRTGQMAITYSSGKNIQIEAGGRVIKPLGGSEGVGFVDLK